MRGAIVTVVSLSLMAGACGDREPVRPALRSTPIATGQSSMRQTTALSTTPSTVTTPLTVAPSSTTPQLQWLDAGMRLDCSSAADPAPPPVTRPRVLVIVIETDCIIRLLDTSGALVWQGPGILLSSDQFGYKTQSADISFANGAATIRLTEASEFGPPDCRTTSPIDGQVKAVFCSTQAEAGIRLLGADGTWGPLLLKEMFLHDGGNGQVYRSGSPRGALISPDEKAILVDARMACESPEVRVLERDGTPSKDFGGIDGQFFQTVGWTERSEVLLIRPDDGVCGASGRAGLWAIARDGTERRVWWHPLFDLGTVIRVSTASL